MPSYPYILIRDAKAFKPKNRSKTWDMQENAHARDGDGKETAFPLPRTAPPQQGPERRESEALLYLHLRIDPDADGRLLAGRPKGPADLSLWLDDCKCSMVKYSTSPNSSFTKGTG